MKQIKRTDNEIFEECKIIENPEGREWLYIGSAGEDFHKSSFYQLNGSPPKGYIIITPYMGIRLDPEGNKIKTTPRYKDAE